MPDEEGDEAMEGAEDGEGEMKQPKKELTTGQMARREQMVAALDSVCSFS